MNQIDWKNIDKKLNPNLSKIPYRENKHRFTKIGFDVFHLNSSPIESYWILEKDENGKEYLSANYEIEPEEKLQAKGSWEALSDKESKNITLLYKGVPIKRFASSEYGFEGDDVGVFKNALVNKLSVSQEFVDKLMEVLTEEKRDALIEVFPELV